MTLNEYYEIDTRMDAAKRILSDITVAEMKAEHCQNVINRQKVVYVRYRDSRRCPTNEEVLQAVIDLEVHKLQIEENNRLFASI
jgi:hypothetical protein